MPKSYKKGSGDDFAVCPEGMFQGVCVDVIDKGEVEKQWKGETKLVNQVTYVFQVDARDEDDREVRRDDGKMFLVYATFTNSLSDKAKMLPFVNAWLGKPIPEEVRESGFDLDNLIGRNAQLQIVHNPKEGGGVWVNINGILPIARNTPKLAVADGYVRDQDRPDYVPPKGSERWLEQQEAEKSVASGGYPGDGDDGDADDDLPF